VKNLEKRTVRSHIKCVKVRALFVKNKVRFARAEQLWLWLIRCAANVVVNRYQYVTLHDSAPSPTRNTILL